VAAIGAGGMRLGLALYALLLFLAVAVLREGIAGQLVAAGDYGFALKIQPDSSAAHALAAEREYADGRINVAERSAAAALATAPLDAAALRVLAVSRFQLGQALQGAAALRLAGMLGWRDTATQVLLLVDAVLRRDAVTAAQRADALARRGRELPTAAVGLRQTLLLPGGVDAVADRLDQAPSYRLDFLRAVDKLSPRELSAHEALLARLKAGIVPPQPTEFDPYVKLLIARGEYGRARQVWGQWQAQGSANPAALLQDGGFDNVAVGSNGFGWQISPEQASQVEVRSDVVPDRRVLSIETDGTRSAGLIEQLIVLPPGAHVFAANVSYASAAAKSVFQWGVLCLPGGREIPVTPRIGGVGEWQHFELAFNIPAAGCPMQVLHLNTRSIDIPPPSLAALFDRAEIR
jgi:hypothetical protein